MKRLLVLILLAFSVALICTTSCIHKTKLLTADSSNYPTAVAAILVNKCTSSGCHNQASYQNAAVLLLDSWAHLFQGSATGAEIVAYSPLYSPLLYYVNTDSTLGQVATFQGHFSPALTHDEYMTLYNWVAAGAPDKNGNIPFAAPSPDNRQKIYLTLQGCDLLAVIDARSRLIMRYIKIGDAANQTPHDVTISSDGAYAYVSFYNGSIAQKIDVHADTVLSYADLNATVGGGGAGAGGWSIITLSPMDTCFMISGWVAGVVVAVNTSAMLVNEHLSADQITIGHSTQFANAHGIITNATFDTFYTTIQNGVEKFAFNSSGVLSYTKFIAAPGLPHQIEMSPDHSKYFVTCPFGGIDPNTNEVDVFDVHTDSLIKVIQVGNTPQEMDVSTSMPYLFVDCMEDANNPQAGRHGSVYVINYNSLEIVNILYGDFYQPHDVAVDEQDGLVFIPSRDVNPNGPAPHHSSGCGAGTRPGWYSVYDLKTLQPDPKRYDAPADPYAISARFH